MKDDIINVLKNSKKAVDVYELIDLLGITTVADTTLMGRALDELEKEVVIYRSNKGKYMMLEDSHLRKGVLRANKKGFGFVEVDGLDDDIYVSSDNMNGAINDDIVLVEITSKMTLDRLEGRILRIVESIANSPLQNKLGYLLVLGVSINKFKLIQYIYLRKIFFQ